jgi:hypothetical protein
VNISKEATWLPLLGPAFPVSVPEVVAVFEPIERCRSLADFDFDLDAAERIWDEAMKLLRSHLGVDDATWLRGRAWALSITLMIWYYWTTLPDRRFSRMAVGRNVLADAGYST